MILKDFLKKNEIEQGEFARRVGVTQACVSWYCSGRRVPRPSIMRRIIEATAGEVQPNDFYRPKEGDE